MSTNKWITILYQTEANNCSQLWTILFLEMYSYDDLPPNQ